MSRSSSAIFLPCCSIELLGEGLRDVAAESKGDVSRSCIAGGIIPPNTEKRRECKKNSFKTLHNQKQHMYKRRPSLYNDQFGATHTSAQKFHADKTEAARGVPKPTCQRLMISQ